MPPVEFNPRIHHRRSVRLPGHGYAGGWYFVTVCTYERACTLGKVVGGEMLLSALGEVVREEWLQTGEVRREVVLDAFVVMPNHVHGIVGIREGVTGPDVGGGPDPIANPVGATGRSPLRRGPDARPGPPPRSLCSLMAGFKSSATKRINRLRGTPGAAVWQRSYWDRVVRGERELRLARRYVEENPLRWERDQLYPDADG